MGISQIKRVGLFVAGATALAIVQGIAVATVGRVTDWDGQYEDSDGAAVTTQKYARECAVASIYSACGDIGFLLPWEVAKLVNARLNTL